MQYSEMSKEELLTLQAELNQQYAEAKAKGLNQPVMLKILLCSFHCTA